MSNVESLLWEREGYRRRGLKGRVAQVDAALKAAGVSVTDEPVEPEAAVAVAPETAMAPKAKARK